MQQKEKKNPVEERRSHSPVLYWGTVITLVLIVITFVIGPALGSGYAKSIVLGKAAGKAIYFDENFGYAWENYEQNLASVYGLDMQTLPDYMRNQIRVTAFQGAFFMRAYECFVESVLDKSNITATSSKAEQLIAESILDQDPVLQKESLKSYKDLSDRQKSDRIEEVKHNYLFSLFQADLGLIPEIKEFETVFLNEKAFPEKRVLKYLQIDNDSLPDSSFKEYASTDEKKFLFTKITSRKIMVSTKTEIEFLLSEIQSDPEQFETLAKDSTIDTDGGEEKTLYFYEILNELGDKKEKELKQLLNLKSGDLSQVIKTDYGYVLFQLTADPELPDFSDSELIEGIRNYMTYNDAESLSSFTAEFTDAVYQLASEKPDGSLDSAAETYGLTVEKTSPFPVNINGLSAIGRIQNEESQEVLTSFYSDESFFRSVFTAVPASPDILYGDSFHFIYEVFETDNTDFLTDDPSSLNSLIPNGDEGFRYYILKQKSYRDNTEQFMEKYSDMFSYSASAN